MARICLYCARYDFEPMIQEPLGLGYILSYLLQQKIVTKDKICIVDSVEDAIAFRPDILGVSAVSQVIQNARDFAKKCREKCGCLTVLGGYHVTCLPHKLGGEFDIGVLSEGEETFAEIVSLFKANKLTPENPGKIKGICYHKNGDIIVNPSREFINELDSLALPYRRKKYSQIMSLFTSRGCPYRCIFCASHEFWGNKFRLRSSESVISEIAYLIDEYQPEVISIMDDLWIFDKKRFREIADGVIKLRIPEKVCFTGFCRSNIVGEEEIKLLKQMNFQHVRFGAETGSEVLLKRLKGNNISVADHQRVIDLCQKHNIPCMGSFMFGLPGETKADLQATVDFLRKNKGKFEIGGFYFFNPIPGTEIWKWMKNEKMITDEFSAEGMKIDLEKKNFSWNKDSYFNQNNVSLEELKEYVEKIRAMFADVKPDTKKTLGGLVKSYLNKAGIKSVHRTGKVRYDRDG